MFPQDYKSSGAGKAHIKDTFGNKKFHLLIRGKMKSILFIVLLFLISSCGWLLDDEIEFKGKRIGSNFFIKKDSPNSRYKYQLYHEINDNMHQLVVDDCDSVISFANKIYIKKKTIIKEEMYVEIILISPSSFNKDEINFEKFNRIMKDSLYTLQAPW